MTQSAKKSWEFVLIDGEGNSVGGGNIRAYDKASAVCAVRMVRFASVVVGVDEGEGDES